MSLAVLVSGVVLDQPAGGVQRHARELLPRLAERLARDGGRLAVLAGKGGIAFELPDSIEVWPSRVPSRPVLVRATLESRELARVLDDARAAGRGFDLVHTAHLPTPRIELPYVLLLHDLRVLELEHTPFSRRLLGKSLVGKAVHRAARVVTVSEDVRAKLVEWFRLPRSKVVVAPNGCDHFEPLPRATADPSDAAGPPPILFVGHLEPRKNLALVLRALSVDPELPSLVLAGAAKGDEEARLRRLASELGVDGRVRFRGSFDDAELPELYARAGCVVLPSRLEGFGLPVAEAQRAGVPVAIARAGALPEVAGPDAPSFDPDDPAECADALRRALGLAPELLAAARERASARTWDAAAERVLTAWRAAAETRRPG